MKSCSICNVFTGYPFDWITTSENTQQLNHSFHSPKGQNLYLIPIKWPMKSIKVLVTRGLIKILKRTDYTTSWFDPCCINFPGITSVTKRECLPKKGIAFFQTLTVWIEQEDKFCLKTIVTIPPLTFFMCTTERSNIFNLIFSKECK